MTRDSGWRGGGSRTCTLAGGRLHTHTLQKGKQHLLDITQPPCVHSDTISSHYNSYVKWAQIRGHHHQGRSRRYPYQGVARGRRYLEVALGRR